MTYKVQKGDTLFKIATRYGCTVTELYNANRDKIKNINVINVGWVLNIPTKETENAVDVKALLLKCVEDIEALPSYKELVAVLYG